jgi:hypothetical protein
MVEGEAGCPARVPVQACPSNEPAVAEPGPLLYLRTVRMLSPYGTSLRSEGSAPWFAGSIPTEGGGRLDGLKPNPEYLNTDPESLVHLDWSEEWRP